MKTGIVWLLLSVSFVWAQSDQSKKANQASGKVTVSGCLSRSNGDYILMKEDPGNTYQLQASDKLKLGSHLGERVEVTGTKSPTMSTSSDAMNRMGSASAVTITVSSVKTISKECRER